MAIGSNPIVNAVLGKLGVDGNVSISNGSLCSNPCPPLVCGKVEANEKNQVARKNSTTRDGSKFFTGALAEVGHIREICRGKVGVCGEVDETEIDYELSNLKPGNPLLPPNSNTTSGLEVVPVHDDMDCKVKSNRYPRL